MTSLVSTSCPVCHGTTLDALVAAVGTRAYCRTCFHGWRTELRPYSYCATAMCSLGTSDARLASQVQFFAPFIGIDATILEIGCATGELAAETRATLAPRRYEAIELSPAAEIARCRVDRVHTATLGELLRRDVISERFDAILMSHVLEHVDDPAAELAAMIKVLKPGGVIFLEVPNGAGHRHLPIDDNASHLHFFSATSLMRLLARFGLETIAAATDARLDARYADSLQVIARPFAPPVLDRRLLSDHRVLAGEASIVVWGAGSLADEMLANFFDPAKIDFFIDRSLDKQAVECLGKPVRPPSALGSTPRTVLVNSIDFAPAIAGDIAALYPGVAHRVISIAELLD